MLIVLPTYALEELPALSFGRDGNGQADHIAHLVVNNRSTAIAMIGIGTFRRPPSRLT